MDKKTIYKEFCTGCGLCHSVLNLNFHTDQKGFPCPRFKTSQDISFCEKVCPASGIPLKDQDPNNIWGKTKAVYLGYAADPMIRKEASSGGALTSLCLYLLASGKVDGIIQTKAASETGIKTQTVISRTASEVISCSGSRYTISSPLMQITQILRKGERYAFVGKPCDVAALRQYLKENMALKQQIVLLLSFFCAGVPSQNAQRQLLHALHCQEDTCVSLRYRGNGWPGYATALRSDGKAFHLSYNESWGTILGRDVRKICRFCMDGLGEGADISCGDAWYLTDAHTPDFTEREGRNVVFARSTAGENVCLEAAKAGKLILKKYSNYEGELKMVQPYQFIRRSDMGAMMMAMKLCRKAVPLYDSKTITKYSKFGGRKEKWKRFLGTVKRIFKGKL